MKLQEKLFKRVFAFLLVFLLTLGFTSLAFTKTVIKFWYPWGGLDGDLRAELAEEFSRAHPEIKVEPLLVTGAGYEDGKLMAAIAGGQPPDVVLYWNGGNTAGMAARDGLTELTPYLEEAKISSADYDSELWRLVTYKDKVYGIPEIAGVYCAFYYNKDVFDESGLDPSVPPKDIEALDLYAEKMTKYKSNGDIDVAGFIPWVEQGSHIDFWTQVFGGKLFNEDETKVTANDPKVIETFEWMGQYGEKYGAQKFASFVGSMQMDVGNPGHPFYTGKLGMMVSGTWVVAQIRKYVPNLNFGVTQIPTPPDGLKNPAYTGINVWWIPRGSQHVQEALQFIAWMNEAGRMASTADLVANLGSRADARELQKLKNDEIFSIFFEMINTGTIITEPNNPVWPIYFDALIRARDEVIFGRKTAKDALDEVTQKVQAELDKLIK